MLSVRRFYIGLVPAALLLMTGCGGTSEGNSASDTGSTAGSEIQLETGEISLGTTSTTEVSSPPPTLSTNYPHPCIPDCSDEDLSGQDLSDLDLRNSTWLNADLSGVDFSGSDLSGAVFDSVDAFGANFASAILSSAKLTGQFSNASFRRAVFDDSTTFEYSYIARSDFRDSNLSGTNLGCDCVIPMGFSRFDGLDLSGSNLESVDVQGSSFVGSDLTSAVFGEFAIDLDLRNALLVDTDMSQTNVSGSVLVGAEVGGLKFNSGGTGSLTVDESQVDSLADFLATVEDVRVIGEETLPSALQGCAPNCQRQRFDAFDLSGANISGIDFTGSSFVDADLSGTVAIDSDFDGADLSRAVFENAFLYASGFMGAVFADTILSSCDCRKNSFELAKTFTPRGIWQSTDFRGTSFSGIDLRGFKFSIGEESKIALRGAKFVGSDLYRSGFSYRDMHYVDMTGASLVWTDLTTTGFYGASLRDADMMDAEVFDADFDYADIKGANLETSVGLSDMYRLIDAQCGYETFASSIPDAQVRKSCQFPRP